MTTMAAARPSLMSIRNPGDRAVEFFARHLKHTKGKFAGQPFILESWQAKIVRDIFGTLRPDGLRQYRTVYIEIPRKNGKSTLASGLVNYLLFCDNEPESEIYGAASCREQATIVFRQAVSMVRKNKALAGKVKIRESMKRMHHLETGGFYLAIPADADTAHGFNASAVVVDEVHVQPNRHLWDVLTTSMGSREQPLTIAITTAGHDRDSLCWELHSKAKNIIDGIIEDDTFYPVIYGADLDDDWQDPAIWAKANPCLDVSLNRDYIVQACKLAKESPVQENTFRNLHLNQWTEQAVRWIPMANWDACYEPLKQSELQNCVCYGGLDLSSTSDMTSFQLVFPPYGQRDYYSILSHMWVPEDQVEARSKSDRTKYDAWVKDGILEVTPGDRIDYNQIRYRINQLSKQFRIAEISYDKYNAIQLVHQLEHEDGVKLVDFPQTHAFFNDPCKQFESLVQQRRIRHNGHKVLRWHVANAAINRNYSGLIKPDKEASSEKIDGVVATLMALRLALTNEKTSVYQSRGLRSL